MEASGAPQGPHTRRSRRQRDRKLSVVGVLGELFLTAGVLVFLFLGWQLWLNDIIVGAEQRDHTLSLTEEWAAAPQPSGTPTPSDTPTPSAEPGEPVDWGEPIVDAAPKKEATPIAAIYIPRFGADYVRTIGQGVDLGKVLNRKELGVGHYEETQMPGEVGNFALAAHRTTWGAPFNKVAELQLGDKIYVQTPTGWFTYAYRTLEYVLPTGVGVKDPLPQQGSFAATDRIITLTSCNPLFSASERIIAYGVLESWQPTSAGMPADLAAIREGIS